MDQRAPELVGREFGDKRLGCQNSSLFAVCRKKTQTERECVFLLDLIIPRSYDDDAPLYEGRSWVLSDPHASN